MYFSLYSGGFCLCRYAGVSTAPYLYLSHSAAVFLFEGELAQSLTQKTQQLCPEAGIGCQCDVANVHKRRLPPPIK